MQTRSEGKVTSDLPPHAQAEHFAHQLKPFNTLPGVKELIEFLEERVHFWSNRHWRVGLIGITSSGKSTLVNGFFREKLLPAHVRPSSNALIISRKGNSRRAVVHFLGNKEPHVIEEDLATWLEFYGGEQLNPRNKLGVRAIEVVHPRFALGQDALLIDTPGLDAYSFDDHEKLTLQTFLPTVDLVVFLATTKANSDGITAYYLREIKAAAKPIVLVQNLIDAVEEKIGPGGRVLKSKAQVAEERGKGLQRLAMDALDDEDIPVYQIAAKLALEEGESERSGLGKLAAVIEEELVRRGPHLDTGRRRQLLGELVSSTPAATKAEAKDRDSKEEQCLTRAKELLEQLDKRICVQQRGNSSKNLEQEKLRILDKARSSRKSDVDGIIDEIKSLRSKFAAELLKSSTPLQGLPKEIASELGMNAEDYIDEPISEVEIDEYETPERTEKRREQRDKPGFLNWLKRTFNWGGTEEITIERKVFDKNQFYDDVKQLLEELQQWRDDERNRLFDIYTSYKITFDKEIQRRGKALESRKRASKQIEQQTELREVMLKWRQLLQRQINASPASDVMPRSKGVKLLAALEKPKTHESNPVALKLLSLAERIARVRFEAARDSVLARAKSFENVLIAGWDETSLEAFHSRFWPGFPRENTEHVPEYEFAMDSYKVFSVDESRSNGSYAKAVRKEETNLFIIMNLIQPGSMAKAIDRSAHLLQGEFRSVCLVIQSVQVFRGPGGLEYDALVEAVLAAQELLKERGMKPMALLANDDDVGLTAVLDKLMVGDCKLKKSQQQALLNEVDRLIDRDVALQLIGVWNNAGKQVEKAEKRRGHGRKDQSPGRRADR